MRHIPDDELHAYLDQALSRSQCVEIETHLAECAACRDARDAIAALRDQTTHLLGALRPPRRVRPSFEALAAQAAARTSRRRERWQAAAWAASLLGALSLGYGLHDAFRHPAQPAVADAGRPAPEPMAPAAATAGPVEGATTRLAESSPAGGSNGLVRPAAMASAPAPDRGPAPSDASAMDDVAPEPNGTQVSSESLGRNDDLPAAGMWRTVPWNRVPDATGTTPAHVDGLPVMHVQVQSGGETQPGGPLMVVQQQLRSGEVIRTIDGPVADVSKLLSRTGDVDESLADSLDHAATLREGDRMIAVTGQVPADSLKEMIKRLARKAR